MKRTVRLATPSAVAGTQSARPNWGRLLICALLGTLVFAALQIIPLLEQQRRLGTEPDHVWLGLVGAMLAYASLAAPAFPLAVIGRKALAFVPAAVYMLTPTVVGALTHGTLEPNTQPPGMTNAEFLPGLPGVRVSLYLLLAAVPALLSAPSLSARGRIRVGSRTPSSSVLLAFALVVAMAAIGVGAFGTVLGLPLQIEGPVTALIVGLLLADEKPWWPWFHVTYAMCLSGGLAAILSGAVTLNLLLPPVVLWASVLIGTLILLAGSSRRFGAWIRRMEIKAAWLFLTVNALNVADAIFTWWVVRYERSVELNPIVRAIGLPGKVLFVFLASLVVLRVRPGALVVAAGALAVVLAYHVLGFVLST